MPLLRSYVRSLRIAFLCGAGVVAAGLLVILGWITGNDTLLRIRPQWTPMVPSTAVCFILSGSALLAIATAMLPETRRPTLWRRSAMVAAGTVMLIGLRRTIYYLFDWQSPMDMLGFDPGDSPGKMAQITAFGFALAGVALGISARRGFYRIAQWVAALVLFIGWIGITRYFYGGDPVGMFFLMAMHTALLFALLGMGIFYARPDGGFMVIWNDESSGSLLVRRLFPAALIVPVVIGWLRLLGERAGWYGLETGLAIFAMSNVLIFSVLAWHTASRLHDEDALRRGVEKKLIAEKDFSNAVIDSLPGAFYLYDRTGRFLRWNRNFEQVTGYSGKEIAGMRPQDVIAKADLVALGERIAEVFAKGQSHLVARILAKDGTETPYFFTGITLPVAGETCLAGVGIDISERIRAEQKVVELNAELERRVARRTEELQAKNRELETFTYSVSHDLKAPLRGIDGYSRLLLEDYSDKLDAEGRHFLTSVRKASLQMGQLIEDLLAYSQLERRAIHCAAIKPRAVLDALPVSYEDEIRARGVVFSVSLPDVTVNADPSGLSQVLRNLLDNALKFTRTSQPAVIELGGRVEDDVVVIWVKDNGVGFDMKFTDRIFDIFQRLHRAEDYPGTGIGLAIVRKAMERMGGRVWAVSSPGKGAAFYIEIPRTA